MVAFSAGLGVDNNVREKIIEGTDCYQQYSIFLTQKDNVSTNF